MNILSLRWVRYSALAALCSVWSASAADPATAPQFEEVYGLVRSNLAGASGVDLNRDAVQGLLQQLRGKVTLVDGSDASLSNPSPTTYVAGTNVIEGAYGVIRLGRIEAGLPERFATAVQALNADGKLKGLVIDLRFASGQDYSAAAGVADAFVSKEKALLQHGTTTFRSTSKTNAIDLPAAVLVNRETAGAAEALAAVLREQNVGLIIGTTSAGTATQYKEFTLSNGQRLRIDEGQVKLPSGPALSMQGVQPDISVAVTPDRERIYLDDPYRVLTNGPADNANPFRRTNEAELVRRHKEGLTNDDLPDRTKQASGTGPAVLQDPALARAVDLLKGVAFMQKSKSL